MAGSNQQTARIQPAQGQSTMSMDVVPIGFLIQASASFNTFTATTGAAMGWDTQVYDPFNLRDGSTGNIINVCLTRAGLYHTTAFVPLSYTASKNRWVSLQYSLNNSTWTTFASTLTPVGAVTNSHALNVSGYINVTAADLVTAKGNGLHGPYVQVFVGSTSDTFTQNSVAWWGIHRVGMLG